MLFRYSKITPNISNEPMQPKTMSQASEGLTHVILKRFTKKKIPMFIQYLLIILLCIILNTIFAYIL